MVGQSGRQGNAGQWVARREAVKARTVDGEAVDARAVEGRAKVLKGKGVQQQRFKIFPVSC